MDMVGAFYAVDVMRHCAGLSPLQEALLDTQLAKLRRELDGVLLDEQTEQTVKRAIRLRARIDQLEATGDADNRSSLDVPAEYR